MNDEDLFYCWCQGCRYCIFDDVRFFFWCTLHGRSCAEDEECDDYDENRKIINGDIDII